jgi:hypothetical protein
MRLAATARRQPRRRYGLRALLIPHRGASQQLVDAGAYELRFAIDRQRWATEAVPDAGSRYRANATLMVEI